MPLAVKQSDPNVSKVTGQHLLWKKKNASRTRWPDVNVEFMNKLKEKLKSK